MIRKPRPSTGAKERRRDMKKNETDFLKDVASDELNFIASQSSDSSTEAVKDAAVRSIIRSFAYRKVKVEYGKASALGLSAEIRKTGVYRWAECVDGAKSVQELVELVKANFDAGNVSNMLLQTWMEALNRFGIRWRFKFPVPGAGHQNEPIHRSRRRVVRLPAGAFLPGVTDYRHPDPPKRHWLEEVPEDVRPLVQIMSEQRPTPFQIAICKTILLNRFDEERVIHFKIAVPYTTGGLVRECELDITM
jgi:hypothetical protein